MSFKMAELDRFPGHRREDGGARRRGGILRSTLCVELPGPVGGGPFLVGRKEWLRAEDIDIIYA